MYQFIKDILKIYLYKNLKVVNNTVQNICMSHPITQVTGNKPAYFPFMHNRIYIQNLIITRLVAP